MNRTQRLLQRAPQDRERWQTLFYRNPQHSRRRRLLALQAVWDGASMAAVCRTQGVQRKTLETWLDRYLQGGFTALLAPQTRARAQTLSPPRRQILRFILLHKTPKDYGIDAYQWTAAHVQELLRMKWELSLSANRLYAIFAEWRLSHQTAHRD
jgi:transposase